MASTESHEFRFQCPNCGYDLKQTIRRLKANEHMTCPGCNIGINVDADRSADGVAEIRKAMDDAAPGIVIKFFR